MEQFEHHAKETNPEVIKERLSILHQRAEELRTLAADAKENIDAELGSEEYIDFGYTTELRDDVLPEIERLETRLRELDDQDAAQRKLL